MCNDPTIHTRTIITCNQHTEFAFEASPNGLQLIIGRGGQGDGHAGSSVHLHLYDALIVVPKLRDVLGFGQEALEGIAQLPVPQVVQWPPRRRQPRHGQQQ
jgi:hypothetical protein